MTVSTGVLAHTSPRDDERTHSGHRLVVSCPDRGGIVAAVAGFLNRAGANITHSAQYSTDPNGGTLFMRMEFELWLTAANREALGTAFAAEVAEPFDMQWVFSDVAAPKRVAILVSRYDHCLLDILWRWQRNQLDATIGVVISNHADLRSAAEQFGVPYVHILVEKGRKPEAEAQILDTLGEYGPFDVVVLARYMQILSGDFLQRWGKPIINIHHSFLPAFAGAGPYQRAKERGVKLIGATAHYVTEELDAGPIIEQDVARATHEHDAEQLEHMGADIERLVLARALAWHCEDRVMVYGNSTVIF
jgi:formyltetrahydrofolate deformylase